MNTCLNCKYARQAGDKKRLDVVGCVISTNHDGLVPSHTGKQFYRGYWHTCYPNDLSSTGSYIYGILVNSDESCKRWEANTMNKVINMKKC